MLPLNYCLVAVGTAQCDISKALELITLSAPWFSHEICNSKFLRGNIFVD